MIPSPTLKPQRLAARKAAWARVAVKGRKILFGEEKWAILGALFIVEDSSRNFMVARRPCVIQLP